MGAAGGKQPLGALVDLFHRHFEAPLQIVAILRLEHLSHRDQPLGRDPQARATLAGQQRQQRGRADQQVGLEAG